jgi:hypothetical protein
VIICGMVLKLSRRTPAVIFACLVWLPAVSAVAGQRQPDGPSIPVHVSAQGKVLAPAQVQPFYEEIRNHSDHELVMVGAPRYGAGRLVADLRRGDAPILPGRLARDFVVVDTIAPHGDVFTTLRRGTYLIAERSSNTATAADVATVRVAGTRSTQPVPLAASEVRFTKTNHLSLPDPTYAESALYIVNHGTRTVQIRLYRLARPATAAQITAFTSHPSWARLSRLPVTSSTDLATITAGHWVSDGNLPAVGRYIAVAAPLLPSSDHRPQLKPALVASTNVKN